MEGSSVDPLQQEPNSIIIPSHSFTAFKLSYDTPYGICKTSTVISLGIIPKSWILNQKSWLFSTMHKVGDGNQLQQKKTRSRTTQLFDNAQKKFRSERHKIHKSSKKIMKSTFGVSETLDTEFDQNAILDTSDDDSSETGDDHDEEHDAMGNVSGASNSSIPIIVSSDTLANDKNHETGSHLSSLKAQSSIRPSSASSRRRSSISMSTSRNQDMSKSLSQVFTSKSNESTINSRKPLNLSWSNNDILNFHRQIVFTADSLFDNVQPSGLTQSVIENNNSVYSSTKFNKEIKKVRLERDHTRNQSQASSVRSFVTAHEFPSVAESLDGTSNNMYDGENEISPITSINGGRASDNSIDSTLEQQTLTTGGPNLMNSVSFEETPKDSHPQKRNVVFSPSIPAKEKIGPTLQKQKKGKKVSARLLKADPNPQNQEDEEVTEDDNKQHNGNGQIKNLYARVTDDVAYLYNKVQHKSIGARNLVTNRYSQFEQKQKLKKLFEEFSAGNIIKMEKMLVLVTLSNGKKGSEGQSLKRVIEKWKEYIVVIRSTGNHEYPLILQFFKNRKITEKDTMRLQDLGSDGSDSSSDSDSDYNSDNTNLRTKQRRTKSKLSDGKDCEFEIPLSVHDTKVQFHNLLDKSISISKTSKKKRFLKYILLPQTPISGIRWLSFLTTLLEASSRSQHKTILLRIPDLDISLTIKNLQRLYNPSDFSSDSSTLNILYSRDGYIIPRRNIFHKLVEMVSQEVSQLPVDRLPDTPEARKILYKLSQDTSMLAFATKKYDRLEWILGDNEKILQAIWLLLNETHDIELRELKHDPLLLNDGTTVEPFPIEGFLVKLSNRSGRLTSRFGRQYFKVNYFYTVDNLLMFQNFYTAVPSFQEPMAGVITPIGDVLNEKKLDEIVSNRKSIFEHSAFPLDKTDNTHISWLKPGLTEEEFAHLDKNALYEAERRSCLIANGYGLIDLCQVQRIETVPVSEVTALIKLASTVLWGYSKDEVSEDEISDSCFDIVMKNGTRFRLHACNRVIRDEWVSRLQQLCQYWVLKKKEDLQRLINLREINMENGNITDDFFESLMASDDSANKWEVSKAYADSTIYNISSWSVDKPIIMSGILYKKRKKHSSFKQFFIILCPGFLILYEMFERSKVNGAVKPTAYYKHFSSISLNNCYVYCNPSSDGDLITKDTSFSHTHPGGHSVPRIYADGWKSSEDQDCRYFTVWFGSKILMLRNVRKNKSRMASLGSDSSESSSDDDTESDERNEGSKSGGKKADFIKTASRLGVTGKSMIFLARSRVERDLWVTKLSTEIERFSNANEEEIQLV